MPSGRVAVYVDGDGGRVQQLLKHTELLQTIVSTKQRLQVICFVRRDDTSQKPPKATCVKIKKAETNSTNAVDVALLAHLFAKRSSFSSYSLVYIVHGGDKLYGDELRQQLCYDKGGVKQADLVDLQQEPDGLKRVFDSLHSLSVKARKGYVCKQCLSSFDRELKLTQHMQIKHPMIATAVSSGLAARVQSVSPPSPTPLAALNKAHACKQCKSSFDQKEKLTQHTRDKHLEEVKES